MAELGNVETAQGTTVADIVQNILRKLCADEWIAFCQYILGSYAAKGRQINAVEKTFVEIADDERNDHQVKLMNWMQSNGMHPEFNYVDINEAAGTKFVPIRDEISTAELITIAIQGEKEAIDAYTAAMEAEEIKTYPDLVVMLGEILVDEREHLKMLEDLRSSVSTPAQVSNFSTRIKAALKNFSTNPFSEDDKVKILEYAQTLATEVFGDKKDDEIVKKVADHAMKESDSLEAALGIVKNSYTK